MDTGTEPEEPMPDPFDVLGVASDSSSDEITIAYRRLVERHHPDRLSGASREQRAAAHDRMAEINAVYRMLTDPVELARWRHLSRGDSPPATEDGVRFSVADDRRYRGMDWAEPDPDFDYRRRAPAEFTVGRASRGKPWTAGGPRGTPKRRRWRRT